MVQNDKKIYPSCSVSEEPYIIWLLFMVNMCKMIISPGVFFQFFKILIFWVVSGIKGQKAVPNHKKFCLSCFISQEPCIIWLSFMVHMCKMIISLGIYCIFSKFWFFRVLVGERAKHGPKWQVITSVALHISGTLHHMTVIYGTHL